MLARIFVLLATGACAGAAIATAKGFFCRDPDTGKLYPANTTWPSTSFCGSYTCMLRKRNLTESEIKSQYWRQPGFIEAKNNDRLRAKESTDDILVKNTNPTKAIQSPKENVTRQAIEELIRRSQEQNKKLSKISGLGKQDLDSNKDGDRYLSDAEIKTLSTILKTLKKSDLEAILDIYDLAQDIYKEMDTDSNEPTAFVAVDAIANHTSVDNKEKKGLREKRPSYWYEPLGALKHKDSDIVAAIHVKSPEPGAAKDTTFAGSEVQPEIIVSHAQPIHAKVDPNSAKAPMRPDPLTFFSGLNQQKFAKLPYYYPMTDFQRAASYVRASITSPQPKSNQNSEPKIPSTDAPKVVPLLKTIAKPPCPTSPAHHALLPGWYGGLFKVNKNHKSRSHPQIHVHVPVAVETDHKPLTSSIVAVPYQVAYVNYNHSSSPQYLNGNGNPWEVLQLNKSNKQGQTNHAQALFDTRYMANMPNAVLVNPESNEDVQDIEQIPVKGNEVPSLLEIISKAVKRPKGKLFPDWQTDDLSANVLKEIKANSKNKLSPIPLRKKVKLDRVGKVIKIEDRRRKRDTNNVVSKEKKESGEEFEVFLQKSLCVTDTEPGFFRVGNLTQPFPKCCPQRIVS